MPFFVALVEARLPQLSIVTFLRCLAIIHAVLERSYRGVDIATRLPIEPKIQLLISDLKLLQSETLPGIDSAIRQALQFASWILENSTSCGLAGVLYVLEGSQSGAIVLRQAYAQCLRAEGNNLSYFGCYGNSTRLTWQTFLNRLNSLDLSDDEADVVVNSALHTFDTFAAICSSLYPFKEGDLIFAAAGINPEAGDHCIPQEPREIDLALRAGKRIWESFPYLEIRFGERGKRFATSDSCWLVAITNLPSESVSKSLIWLRSVLAVRGMPTIILEQHLRELAKSLREEIPEIGARCCRYDEFLAIVEDERNIIIPSVPLDRVTAMFERTLVSCGGLRVESAAHLIASAWIDEQIGITGALAATESWFLNPDRFSSDWINTMKNLVQTLAGNR